MNDRNGLIYIPGTPLPQEGEELLGGKALALARLVEARLPVPEWFAVTSRAFDCFLHAHGDTPVREAVATGTVPTAVSAAVADALEECGLKEEFLAVRSSAVGEDGAGLSYAGQLESFLFVRPEDVEEYIRRVWASAFTERVRFYRERNGLTPEPPGVAVIVQRMIDADISGVAFGLDPVTGDRDAVVVSAVLGLGEALVSGLTDADRFVVREGSVVEREIAEKPLQTRFNREAGSGTIIRETLAADAAAPSLTDAEALDVAALVRRLEHLFGGAQDVEWAFLGTDLYLLQSRPVTGRKGGMRMEGERVVWDNANIVESYAGVTTPLTFSFVREVYTAVYREFSRIMGVTERSLMLNADVFEMLGLVRGRIYYNLLNWYRVLALLPGYSINARFMEEMMGVGERLEETPNVRSDRSNPYVRVTVSLYRLLVNLFTLPRRVDEFHRHLDDVLKPYEERQMVGDDPDTLIRSYRDLEHRLLLRWRTPILNDFYTMIFHGLLKKCTAKWIASGGEAETLHNDLLTGEGGIISTEPIRELREIAALIAGQPELHRAFAEAPADRLYAMLEARPDIRRRVDHYLARFGDRYIAELKLETITPKENPTLLMELLKPYLADERVHSVAEADPPEGSIRRAAERRVAKALKGRPLRRRIFSSLLRHTRERVKARENLRFERTRVFGVVRRIFLAFGAWLRKEGVIREERDVFFLGKNELFDYVGGRAPATDLVELVRIRKEEFSRYSSERPPDRFETRGAVYIGNEERMRESRAGAGDGTQMQGTACSPGVVRAPVRIVTDPRDADGLRGCILVAERTDPGWAPLFPLARGILVERGSLLSHSAIVAREIGLPAVVGIKGLLAGLVDGETVEMDGAAGTVRLFREEGEEAHRIPHEHHD